MNAQIWKMFWKNTIQFHLTSLHKKEAIFLFCIVYHPIWNPGFLFVKFITTNIIFVREIVLVVRRLRENFHEFWKNWDSIILTISEAKNSWNGTTYPLINFNYISVINMIKMMLYILQKSNNILYNQLH